jgi:type VI secretion system secreted protein VgrG
MANGSAAISQEGRLLKISGPFDPDYLLLQSIELVEEISRLPRAECVVLHDEHSDIGMAPTLLDVQGILGQTVTIQFETEEGTIRHFNGMVNSCTQMDRRTRYTSYRLEIVPSIWLLTQNQESRIFQNVTIQEVLEQILGEAFSVEYQLSSVEWKKRNYVVQYRESDFNFISRLMEEEGIFYYFTHADEVHKMLICVDGQSHLPCPSKAELPYIVNVEEGEFKSRISDLTIDYKLQTGKVTLWDYTFEKPKSNFAMSQPSRFKFGDNESAEHYLFPAGSARKHDVIDASNGERGEELQNISDDIKRTAEFMQQTIDSRHKVIKAISNCCSFTAGHKFKLTTHPTKDMVGSYVITRVSHRAVQSPVYNASLPEGGYENSFECIPWGESSKGEKAVPFRPERITPKPMILTAQTATVVGKAGEEIYTDKYGRVKVQFNWDREGQSDEGSSCWVRVSQLWAGNRWGAMFIPRIGMEVLVHFLEGDPDQPIITGCVYNQDAMPPYELPDEKTKSGIKSDSTKGGEGFNEWRFEDKKGEEQIFMHGEKDLDIRIKNDRREWTGNDQHLVIVNDRREKISNDTHLLVENDQIEHIKRDRHLKVGTSPSNKEAKEVTGTQTLKVGGDQGIKVMGSHSTEVTGPMYLKGMNVVVEGMVQLSLKVGGSFVDINPAGVFISGPMVMINSGGAAGGGSPVGPCPPTAPDIADDADDAKPGTKMKLLQRSQERKKKRPAKEDPKKKSWIKLKLVDEEGKPVPGEAYEIKTSDGKYRTGSLNNKGEAHVKGIEPGNCEVTFPNLDKDAWEEG